jgi:hypothetical protein
VRQGAVDAKCQFARDGTLQARVDGRQRAVAPGARSDPHDQRAGLRAVPSQYVRNRRRRIAIGQRVETQGIAQVGVADVGHGGHALARPPAHADAWQDRRPRDVLAGAASGAGRSIQVHGGIECE